MALGLIFFFDPFFLEGAGRRIISNILSEKEGRPPKISYEDGVIMSNPSNPTSLHFPPTRKMKDPLWRLIDTKEKSSRTHVKENFWLVRIRIDKQKA